MTGVVARCWMLLWDRKLKERLIRYKLVIKHDMVEVDKIGPC